jgi:hypothetical protein
MIERRVTRSMTRKKGGVIPSPVKQNIPKKPRKKSVVVKKQQSPEVKKQQSPVKKQKSPVKKQKSPVKKQQSPEVKKQQSPVKKQQSPEVKKQQSPVKKSYENMVSNFVKRFQYLISVESPVEKSSVTKSISPVELKKKSSKVKSPQVKVESPQVKVKSPQVKVKSPQVKVKSPQVKVESPQVKVKSPQVKVKSPKVKVKSPQVKVESPKVKVESPQVKVKSPPVPEETYSPYKFGKKTIPSYIPSLIRKKQEYRSSIEKEEECYYVNNDYVCNRKKRCSWLNNKCMPKLFVKLGIKGSVKTVEEFERVNKYFMVLEDKKKEELTEDERIDY